MTANCSFQISLLYQLGPCEREIHICRRKAVLKTISKKSVRFDLIHAHFLENGFIGGNLKDLHNVPLVITAHGGDVYDAPFRDSWGNAFARHVLRKADRVITVSQFNANILLSFGVSVRKLNVIPNGFDES